MQQKTDAQWIKTFTPYFVTQQHVRIRTWDVTTKEAVVTQIIPHGVHLSVISGADHQIPFADILEVRRVGDAGIVLDPRVTQSIGRITEAMAQGGSLRIETANACIETAQARGLTLVAVTVVDCVHHARMLIPLQEIIHLTSGIDRAVAHRTAVFQALDSEERRVR